MPDITTFKYHNHAADQFVESLTEGLRTFGTNTISTTANLAVLTTSGNVFNDIRIGDILIINTNPDEPRQITNVSSDGRQLTVNLEFSTAITTQGFKVRDAIAFYDTYYLFIGRSTSWPNGDTSISNPLDSEETQYDYLDDILALRRITSDDLIFVVPRHDWEANSKYDMYTHTANIAAVVTANTQQNNYPMFVRTSTNDVFKCIFNGQTNATSGPARCLVEPSISGVASPADLVTTPAETSPGANDTYYLWKYLYSITSIQDERFVTGNFMPVTSPIDVIDSTTGDIEVTASAAYTVFNTARTTGNGAIYKIIVEATGSNYTGSLPEVFITGDGQGAVATVERSGGEIKDIHMVAYGENYSFATASIVVGVGASGSGATAKAIISPRNSFSNTSGLHYRSNHGINIKDELYARHVMLYVEFSGSEGGILPTANDYRRIGILKNPKLLTGEIAANNLYDLTTTLNITGGDIFNKDEIVYQPSTGAYGVVVQQNRGAGILKLNHVSRTPFSSTVSDTRVIGIGNGNSSSVIAASNQVVPAALPESFIDEIPASSSIASVTGVTSPQIAPRTGEILYAHHVTPIFRSETQAEVIRTVLTF